MKSSQLKPLVTLVALLALAGCASAPKSSVRVIEPNAELASVIGRAQQGEQVQLPAGNSLGVDSVIVGRTYFAASGRECRRLRQTNGAPMQRVACKSKNGEWQFARDLSVSSSSSNSTGLSQPQLKAAQLAPSVNSTQLDIAPNDKTDDRSILAEAVRIEAPVDGTETSESIVIGEPIVVEPIVVESDSELPNTQNASLGPVLLIPTPVSEATIEIPASFKDNSVEPVTVEEAAIPFAVNINETLWSFAKRTTGNALNWETIAQTNGIDNAKTLASGTVLNVPATLVSRGD